MNHKLCYINSIKKSMYFNNKKNIYIRKEPSKKYQNQIYHQNIPTKKEKMKKLSILCITFLMIGIVFAIDSKYTVSFIYIIISLIIFKKFDLLIY